MFEVAIWVAMLLLTGVVQAQTRAWLDRDRIGLGETVTLNIETDQAGAGAPDYTPLQNDFVVSGNSSSQQYEISNGVASSRLLYAVALQPRREGVLDIAALRIGNLRTQALTLTVTAPSSAPAHAGDAIFIEAETDAQEPYVQQAVGYTVRLYYAVPGLSGQLDQATPDGASLQQVEEVQYSRDLGDQHYRVLERRYLLLPERSGTLTIPAARFNGRGAGGFFDELFGNGQRDIHASGAPRFLKVKPIPANAPQPWLPLRALTLRWLDTPQRARAGEAVTLTLEASADGANAAQMPALQLQALDAQGSVAQAASAQIFAEPVQAQESFANGRPQVRLTRRFSIVPAHAGNLQISVPPLAWWDTRAGLARTAALAPVSVQVAPGANAGSDTDAADGKSTPATDGRSLIHIPGVQDAVRPWALAAALLALLWLLTFMWGLHRRSHPQVVLEPAAPSMPPSMHGKRPDLHRALDHGELSEVADALCAAATPPAADLESVRGRLADPAQVAAIDALLRARWAGGDAVAARAALRSAFKHGPRWRLAAKETKEPLPPLYPRD